MTKIEFILGGLGSLVLLWIIVNALDRIYSRITSLKETPE